ncbi:prolyl oligopeptidase family serine peptidase [Tahibacter amnicola]|uniref:prolyl oligopeptidase n=1 Tax=Tahibacter amnicola TaxID=2976241 RepID=A0ABY6BDL4_9GAMM|nr:prolyl oligopeptidase family serine peptidase [Tahibacter amnicola]UXI67205.1 prolyl oligopeptidase family serine peptidase [Tahibacter amnicola]
MRSRMLFALPMLAALVACQPTRPTKPVGALTYPVSRTVEQVDVYHGESIADPYRWLEDIDAAETASWVEAQNKVTFGYLEKIPGRAEIAERLTQIWNYARWTPPFREGKRWFYYKNDGLQNQSVLYVTDKPEVEGQVLLDPNTLSTDGTVALKDTAFSSDGRYMAYGLSSGGSDWEEWRVLDTTTGKPTDDVLRWVKFSTVDWSKDGKGFWYSRYDEPKGENALKAKNEFHKLYFHQLGTPQEKDTLVYERKDQPDWSFEADVTEDGRYLVINVSRGTENKNLVLYRDLQDRSGKIRELISNWEAEYDLVGNKGTTFYFRTDQAAPRNRLVAINLEKPQPRHWKTLVAESKDTLQSAHLVAGQFVLRYLADAHSRLLRYGLDGKAKDEINLPGLGTAGAFTGKPDDKISFYSYTSYTTPSAIYRYDFASGRSTVVRSPQTAFDSSAYETTQVFYTSKDGTRVPMFITARKGVALDGTNPTILYGYGGFNIPQVPAFSASVAGWLDLGGVYAVANLRGGGEYGRQWHEAGTKLQKQNVFDDFIAAAEYLIANNYTSPKRLAIRGGSNGGLLVAAVELQRPELFAAAIPAVGVLDMLRFREFTIGKAWESDYGSVLNPNEFLAIRAYSPLHNIKPGMTYPPTLITTGDHDDRVFPAHSFKFAAAMQAANPDANPFLIRIDVRAGHGQGKPTSKLIAEAADIYAFILKSFGMR